MSWLGLVALVRSRLVQAQSVMLSTNQTFFIVAALFAAAAAAVWLAPKPKRATDLSAAH